MADDCFNDMLSHWLNRPSPPPTKEALIKALRSPAVSREDLAKTVEGGLEAVNKPSKDRTSQLRALRTAVWGVRAVWEDVGVDLGISMDTIKVCIVIT